MLHTASALQSRILLAIWMCALVPAAAAQQAASIDPRPSFHPFRYHEDWSPLADASTHTDWLDPVKYISLGKPGWLPRSVVKSESVTNFWVKPSFGVGPEDNNGYFLQRYLFSADFHFGSSVRKFTELQSGLENGRNGGPRPTDLDRLDVHQALWIGIYLLRTGTQ